VRGVYDRLSAGLLGAVARYQGRTLQTFFHELQGVARELDDARALTWSSDLSDTLGRSQMHLRSLIKELDAETHSDVASRHETLARVEARSANGRDDAGSVAGNWPYLAI
jgi:hypothetical protein